MDSILKNSITMPYMYWWKDFNYEAFQYRLASEPVPCYRWVITLISNIKKADVIDTCFDIIKIFNWEIKI